MPLYRFNIRQGEKAKSRGQQLDFADDHSAWREAALLCRDYSRDIVSEFETHPEWLLEVTDEAGKALFRFWFIAETL
jgi:hypothetical protein